MESKSHVFSARLKSMMKIRGINIEQLAEITGYSIDNIKRYRRNSYNKIPPLEVVRSFADILNCDVAFLTGDTDFVNLKSEHLSDITGISKKASEILTELSGEEIDILSKIIEHKDFIVLIDEIFNFSECDLFDISIANKYSADSCNLKDQYKCDYLKSIFKNPCIVHFENIIECLYQDKKTQD